MEMAEESPWDLATVPYAKKCLGHLFSAFGAMQEVRSNPYTLYSLGEKLDLFCLKLIIYFVL